MLDRVPSSRRTGVALLAVLALLSLFIQPAGVDAQVAVRSKPATSTTRPGTCAAA